MFKQGEVGTKFYIIISGEVDVLLNKDKEFNFTFQEYLEFLKLHHKNIIKVNNKENFKFPSIFNLIRNSKIFEKSKNLDTAFYDEL